MVGVRAPRYWRAAAFGRYQRAAGRESVGAYRSCCLGLHVFEFRHGLIHNLPPACQWCEVHAVQSNGAVMIPPTCIFAPCFCVNTERGSDAALIAALVTAIATHLHYAPERYACNVTRPHTMIQKIMYHGHSVSACTKSKRLMKNSVGKYASALAATMDAASTARFACSMVLTASGSTLPSGNAKSSSDDPPVVLKLLVCTCNEPSSPNRCSGCWKGRPLLARPLASLLSTKARNATLAGDSSASGARVQHSLPSCAALLSSIVARNNGSGDAATTDGQLAHVEECALDAWHPYKRFFGVCA
jgi:hypothetical protein